MGNWNQDSSGLSDEDMDQSLQQDIAAANFAASGGDLGNYTFGRNFVNDANTPGYTGPSTNINQAISDMQSLFNTQRGITASNPYGKEGFFSRVLGIDPSRISYDHLMDVRTRNSIANNQFSKYMNPQNKPGQIGYNENFDPAPPGQLRAGVQSKGYQTVYGPVMEQAKQQTLDEMTARGMMGLFGGLPGLTVGQLGTTEYGLPGLTGFESFDPNNPRAGAGFIGSTMLGGLNTSQATRGIESLLEKFSNPAASTSRKPTSPELTSDSINTSQAPGNLRSTTGTQTAGMFENFQYLSDKLGGPLNAVEAIRNRDVINGMLMDQGGVPSPGSKVVAPPAARSPTWERLQENLRNITPTSSLGTGVMSMRTRVV